MPRLEKVVASHTRWNSAWLLGKGMGGPFSANLLLLPPSHYSSVICHTWNSGRHAPGVTLTLTFDAPVVVLRLCPHMIPETGFVGLVITTTPGAGGAHRTAHRSVWREGVWVSIALPSAARELRLEFMESPSWIALHAVEGG